MASEGVQTSRRGEQLGRNTMSTNYQAPRFAFYHLFRRSTYNNSVINAATPTPYQTSFVYVEDDYSSVLFNFESVTSPTSGATASYWGLSYQMESLADPSAVWNYRPAFVPYALIIPPGHAGLDSMTTNLAFADSEGGVAVTYSNSVTLGSSLDTSKAVVVEWNWAADSTYEDKDTVILYLARGDASNPTPPSFGELFLTRIVEPARGPVATWEHTETPNVTTLRSDAGVSTTWVKGRSLRRWSLEFKGLSNDVGSPDPATGTPVGWNLEPSGGASDYGSMTWPMARARGLTRFGSCRRIPRIGCWCESRTPRPTFGTISRPPELGRRTRSRLNSSRLSVENAVPRNPGNGPEPG